MLRVLSAHGLFSLSRAFIGAVLVIYLINKGVALSVISIAKSAQLVTSIIFNYPSGLVADKYGNKLAILLACLSELIYFYLMLNPSNSNVIIGEIFIRNTIYCNYFIRRFGRNVFSILSVIKYDFHGYFIYYLCIYPRN